LYQGTHKKKSNFPMINDDQQYLLLYQQNVFNLIKIN
jgi:hypothetical protein